MHTTHTNNLWDEQPRRISLNDRLLNRPFAEYWLWILVYDWICYVPNVNRQLLCCLLFLNWYVCIIRSEKKANLYLQVTKWIPDKSNKATNSIHLSIQKTNSFSMILQTKSIPLSQDEWKLVPICSFSSAFTPH